LGKDSMRYFNEVKISELAYENLQEFHKGKKTGKSIFDAVDPMAINEYLKELMPGLTAKVFRTYNASVTLEQELKKCTLDVSTPDREKVLFYNKVNTTVAVLCNHQRSVPKGHEGQIKRLNDNLSAAVEEKEQLEELLEELGGGKKKKKSKEPAKKKAKKEDDDDEEGKKKKKDKKLPTTVDQCEKAIAKITEKVRNLESKAQLKDETKAVALGTSKINYMDPRITVAWCKAMEVPIEKLFNKSLIDKFPWAMEVPSDWTFDPKNTGLKKKEDD